MGFLALFGLFGVIGVIGVIGSFLYKLSLRLGDYLCDDAKLLMIGFSLMFVIGSAIVPFPFILATVPVALSSAFLLLKPLKLKARVLGFFDSVDSYELYECKIKGENVSDFKVRVKKALTRHFLHSSEHISTVVKFVVLPIDTEDYPYFSTKDNFYGSWELCYLYLSTKDNFYGSGEHKCENFKDVYIAEKFEILPREKTLSEIKEETIAEEVD